MVFHSKSLPIDPKTGKLLDDADNRPLELYRHFSIRDHSASVFERCYSVNLVTPFPSIYVKHEAKNPGYTPKFELTFYLTEPIHRKVFQIYLPLTLMLLLHFFNMYIRKMDGASYVENTSSIALALVFLLPSVSRVSTSRRSLLTMQPCCFYLPRLLVAYFERPVSPRRQPGDCSWTTCCHYRAFSCRLLPLACLGIIGGNTMRSKSR